MDYVSQFAEMTACHHPKENGRTRCKPCEARYKREWRKTKKALRIVTESRAARIEDAVRESRLNALRDARVALLEVGDLRITGFDAAEIVRKLVGLD